MAGPWFPWMSPLLILQLLTRDPSELSEQNSWWGDWHGFPRPGVSLSLSQPPAPPGNTLESTLHPVSPRLATFLLSVEGNPSWLT
jgi:hypothetical protein